MKRRVKTTHFQFFIFMIFLLLIVETFRIVQYYCLMDPMNGVANLTARQANPMNKILELHARDKSEKIK